MTSIIKVLEVWKAKSRLFAAKQMPNMLTAIFFMLLLTMPEAAFAQERTMTLVAQNDCGVDGRQAFLVKGDNYTWPDEIKGRVKLLLK